MNNEKYKAQCPVCHSTCALLLGEFRNSASVSDYDTLVCMDCGVMFKDLRSIDFTDTLENHLHKPIDTLLERFITVRYYGGNENHVLSAVMENSRKFHYEICKAEVEWCSGTFNNDPDKSPIKKYAEFAADQIRKRGIGHFLYAHLHTDTPECTTVSEEMDEDFFTSFKFFITEDEECIKYYYENVVPWIDCIIRRNNRTERIETNEN